MAIYKSGRGCELGTTENKSSKWSERDSGLTQDSNPRPRDCKSDALNTRPRCLSGNLICCRTGLNVDGKTRNIAFQSVLQQCCKTSCTFFVARFSVALVKSRSIPNIPQESTAKEVSFERSIPQDA